MGERVSLAAPGAVAATPEASARTLTVFSTSGLANRLRVLLSGLALAEASGRTFRMLWPRNPACGAAFADLFVNAWPVTAVDTLPAQAVHYDYGWSSPVSPTLLLADPRPEIVIGLNSWLISPGHASPTVRARCLELMAALQLVPALRDRISEFRQRYYRTTMIGVHLRRGDFLYHRPDVAQNTPGALAALDRFLAAAPDAGIFLATDDGAQARRAGCEGVRELFRARYGQRLVSTTPRTLDRRTVEAVQDAVVDLWLLRATQMVVGTRGSSFSSLATFGRDVERVLVGGPTPGYRRLERLSRLTGMYWAVPRLFRAVYGYDRPFPQAWNGLVRERLRHWARRLARRHASP